MSLIQFMLPTPEKIDKRSVSGALAKLGLVSSMVSVWGDLGKIFVKPLVWLRPAEYKLFKTFVERMGGHYRVDYKVWVIRVGS